MLRRTLTPLAALALLLAGGAAAQTPPSAGVPTFLISGYGWGHGVGMSQWGAYGYAQHGLGYEKILAHYYPGTALAPAPVSRLRVLLEEDENSTTIASSVPFSVEDAAGAKHPLAAGAVKLGPGLRVEVKGKKVALPGPLLFEPGSAPLSLDRPYRGSIQVTSVAGKLLVVNVVGLGGYLKGVVPSEMPFDWLPEALKAQAVVARSYALAVRKSGLYDLYSDTRSQVYGGLAVERPSTNAAVDETAGQVLTYEGRVAVTYFFSTSGGRTAAIQDVWPNARPVPYLVSVPDPYDSISPHHRWGPFPFTAVTLARRLHVPGRLLDAREQLNGSGRVSALVLRGPLGEVTVASDAVRTMLGLRSTWFRLGMLSLAPPAAPVVYGSSVVLQGVARGVDTPVLEQKVGASPWQPVGTAAATKEGSVAFPARPTVTTDYRLASGSTAAKPVRVSVAPLVRLSVGSTGETLQGSVRPILQGATVAVQRLTGPTWTSVAAATIDAKGAFHVSAPTPSGTYRARLAPGGGFVPGVSPSLRVTGA